MESCPSRRPVRGVDRNGAPSHPGYAGAEFPVLSLLLVAEENVPVIDDPVRLDDIESAEAAFTAPAIEDHIDAGGLQSVEHALILRHLHLAAKAGNPDPERLRGEASAVAESLEAELVHRAAALMPGPLGGLQQPDGATDIELAPRGQVGDLGGEVDAGALLVHEDVQPVSDLLLKVVRQSQILPPAARVVQPETGSLLGERQ